MSKSPTTGRQYNAQATSDASTPYRGCFVSGDWLEGCPRILAYAKGLNWAEPLFPKDSVVEIVRLMRGKVIFDEAAYAVSVFEDSGAATTIGVQQITIDGKRVEVYQVGAGWNWVDADLPALQARRSEWRVRQVKPTGR